MFRSQIYIWVLICFVAVSGYYVSKRLTTGVIAHAQINVTPYTAQIASFSLKNGSWIAYSRETRSRGADGSRTFAFTRILENGATISSRRVERPDGSYQSLADTVGMKSTGQRTMQEIAQIKANEQKEQSTCVHSPQDVVEGNASLFGHPAVIVAIDLGGKRMRQWRFPEFSCQPLQMETENKLADGSYQLVFRSQLQSLSSISPTPVAVADSQPDYAEAPPSAAEQKVYSDYGLPPCDTCAAKWSAQDQAYYAHLPSK